MQGAARVWEGGGGECVSPSGRCTRLHGSAPGARPRAPPAGVLLSCRRGAFSAASAASATAVASSLNFLLERRSLLGLVVAAAAVGTARGGIGVGC